MPVSMATMALQGKGVISAARAPTSGTEQTTEGRSHPTSTVVVDNPKHPEYNNIDTRIASYQGFPDNLDQTPRQMSEAGFYFVGVPDFTRCFCCGGGLRNWEPGDDPMFEHTRWFPRCEYVNKLKGERYVAIVQRRHQEHMAEQQRQQIELAQRRDENLNPPDPMTTDAAAVMREMGYSVERTREAILAVRQQTGVSVVTTQQVLIWLLDKGDCDTIRTPRNTDTASDENSNKATNNKSAKKKSKNKTGTNSGAASGDLEKMDEGNIKRTACAGYNEIQLKDRLTCVDSSPGRSSGAVKGQLDTFSPLNILGETRSDSSSEDRGHEDNLDNPNKKYQHHEKIKHLKIEVKQPESEISVESVDSGIDSDSDDSVIQISNDFKTAEGIINSKSPLQKNGNSKSLLRRLITKENKTGKLSYQARTLKKALRNATRYIFCREDERQVAKQHAREKRIYHRSISVFGLGSYFHRLNNGPPPTTQEQMQYEWLRLASFNNYSGNGNALALARNGFYHEPSEGPASTRCYLCNVNHSNWEMFDDVNAEHRRQSPDCPFHTNSDQENLNISISSGVSDISSVQTRTSAPVSTSGNATVTITAASSSAEPAVNEVGRSLHRTEIGHAQTSSNGGESISRQPTEDPESVDRSILALAPPRTQRALRRSGCSFSTIVAPRRNGAGSNDLASRQQNLIRHPHLELIQRLGRTLPFNEDDLVLEAETRHRHDEAPCLDLDALGVRPHASPTSDLQSAVDNTIIQPVRYRVRESTTGTMAASNSSLSGYLDESQSAATDRKNQCKPKVTRGTISAVSTSETRNQQTGANQTGTVTGKFSTSSPSSGEGSVEKQLGASGGDSDESNSKTTADTFISETSIKSTKKKIAKKKVECNAGIKAETTGATGGGLDSQSLEAENEKLREMQLCKICMKQPVNTTLIPCGHLVCCNSCASRLQRCPICRKRIKGTVKTFMS